MAEDLNCKPVPPGPGDSIPKSISDLKNGIHSDCFNLSDADREALTRFGSEAAQTTVSAFADTKNTAISSDLEKKFVALPTSARQAAIAASLQKEHQAISKAMQDTEFHVHYAEMILAFNQEIEVQNRVARTANAETIRDAIPNLFLPIIPKLVKNLKERKDMSNEEKLLAYDSIEKTQKLLESNFNYNMGIVLKKAAASDALYASSLVAASAALSLISLGASKPVTSAIDRMAAARGLGALTTLAMRTTASTGIGAVSAGSGATAITLGGSLATALGNGKAESEVYNKDYFCSMAAEINKYSSLWVKEAVASGASASKFGALLFGVGAVAPTAAKVLGLSLLGVDVADRATRIRKNLETAEGFVREAELLERSGNIARSQEKLLEARRLNVQSAVAAGEGVGNVLLGMNLTNKASAKQVAQEIQAVKAAVAETPPPTQAPAPVPATRPAFAPEIAPNLTKTAKKLPTPGLEWGKLFRAQGKDASAPPADSVISRMPPPLSEMMPTDAVTSRAWRLAKVIRDHAAQSNQPEAQSVSIQWHAEQLRNEHARVGRLFSTLKDMNEMQVAAMRSQYYAETADFLMNQGLFDAQIARELPGLETEFLQSR